MGEDTWFIKLFFYHKPKITYKEYKIGRFNVPGDNPVCSNHPNQIIEHNPLMPSFVRFYVDSKFNLNLSENRILTMLHGMNVNMPQSSLNNWMHQIMEMLRILLEPLMLETIRQSMGRRNWLHSGSHIAAKNIAFMFGLLESCKLNNLNFGEYIEDILTRIVNKESVDISFLPCNYSPRRAEDDAVA